jgi:threonine dehydratase
MTIGDPTLRDIHLAMQRIAGLARRTPLIRSAGLSERVGAAVYLKLESLQETGSFKIRGAANKLLSLTADELARGVVAVSSGNHGRAVAHVAQQLGVWAVICVSERVPAGKVEAIRRLGAEVVVHGAGYDEAEAHSLRLQAERGLTRVDPFDDPAVIAGQGTVGLELLEDLPHLDTVVVPLSGGGLIAGIAVALKAANPAIRVIGTSMDRAPVMVHSLRAGRPLELPEEDTLADALAGGIGLDNRYTFRLVQRYVDEALLVSEDEIAGAMVFALEQERLVVEGGGAVALAAALYGKVTEPGRTVAVVISGGNVDLPLLCSLSAFAPPPRGEAAVQCHPQGGRVRGWGDLPQ